jgi:hypothetical protein
MRALILLPLLLCALPAVADVAGRCCMTDPQAWYFDPPEKIEARFRLYREMGVDTLRVELDWRQLETAPGVSSSSAAPWGEQAFLPTRCFTRTMRRV